MQGHPPFVICQSILHLKEDVTLDVLTISIDYSEKRGDLLMKAYQHLIRQILSRGEYHEDRTRVGTLSLTGEQIKVDMRNGFPLLTIRKLPFRWIATELLWMLSGSTDETELAEQGVMTWAPWADSVSTGKFGRVAGDLGPTYGFLMRDFGADYFDTATRRQRSRLYPNSPPEGIDQIWRLCQLMDTEPNSRRLVVSCWDPMTSNALTIPPCHPMFQIKIHQAEELGEEEMSLHVFSRSQDAICGLPFDLAHFGLLLELLCWVTCRKPRYLVVSFTDVHIYKNHVNGAEELLKRIPSSRPTLDITKEMYHAEPSTPGIDAFVNLLQMKVGDLNLIGYDPLPKIKFDIVV